MGNPSPLYIDIISPLEELPLNRKSLFLVSAVVFFLAASLIIGTTYESSEQTDERFSVRYDIASEHEFSGGTAPRTMSVSMPLPPSETSPAEARSNTLALVLASAVMIAALGAAMAYILWRKHLDISPGESVRMDTIVSNLVIVAFFGITACSLGIMFFGSEAGATPIIPTGNDDVVAEVAPADYIIITADAFSDEVLPLAEWKDKKGYRTALIEMSLIGTEDTEIKQFLQEVYDADTDKPKYLLLVGDHESVPSHYVEGAFWHTDYEYSLLDGDDEYADLAVGRLPADTEDEVNIMVDRILAYEQEPDTGDWYDDALMAGHFQDIDYDNSADVMFMEDLHRASDFLGDDLDFWNVEDPYDQGFTIHTNRTWDAEDGETIFYGGWDYPGRIENPGAVPDAWMDYPDEDITLILDNGVSLVLHRNHGSTNGWSHPVFQTDDVVELENGDMVPIVFSLNCSSGQFDERDAFAEAWLHNPNGGAVAYVGAQTTSYSGYNDSLNVGLLDAMWDSYDEDWTSSRYENTWHIGDVLNYAKHRVLDGYQNDDGTAFDTARMFNLLGDPEMMFRTTTPSQLEVSHPDSVMIGYGTDVVVTVSIDGEPVSGALVSITSQNGEERWIGTTDAEGEVTFQALRATTSGVFSVIVTGRNCTPYKGTIESQVVGTDLVGTDLAVSPLDLYGEDAITVDLEIMNAGGAETVPFDVVFFISDDEELDQSEDVILQLHPNDPAYDPIDPSAYHIGGLDGFMSHSGEVLLSVPITDPFRTDNEYYLIMVTDILNQVPETNEFNNTLTASRSVTLVFMFPEMEVSGEGSIVQNGNDLPSAENGTHFGDINVERGAVSHTFTITNTGTDTLVLTNEIRRVFLLGPDVLDFYLVQDAGSPMAGNGGTTTFMILFDPMDQGLRTATVSIESNDPTADPYAFTISGWGAVPEVEVIGNGVPIDDGDSTPSSIDDTDFGSLMIGGTEVRTFSVQNIGGSDLTLYGDPVVTITGTDAEFFTVVSHPAYLLLGSNGGTTSFTIGYNPTRQGTHRAIISFQSNDTDEGQFSFEIQGAGMPPFIATGVDIDYGDAPNSYKTMIVAGGPAHTIIIGLHLGTEAPDAESNGKPGDDADGDDTTGTPDDEDGISFFPPLTIEETTYSVTVSVTNDYAADANLFGWIDFNQNELFDTGEGAQNIVEQFDTEITLSWNNLGSTIPINAGTTYARFRLTTDATITMSTPGGAAANGEVEDYKLSIHSTITGNSGTSQPHTNLQPANTLNYCIATQGLFPSRNGEPVEESTEQSAENEPFLAEIRLFACNFAPRGWLQCDGQILPINQNQSLYSLLGTTYGGDGRTSFALPDLRGRVPVGFGTGFNIGQKGGGETHILSQQDLPSSSHAHSLPGTGYATSSVSGGGQPHNNLQPYLVLNYLIALTGTYPSRSGESSEGGIDAYIAEIMLFAGNFAIRSWAFCKGQLLAISQNTALFSLIGTTYGGDGRTTTALPNLQGRTAIHAGANAGPGLTRRMLGARLGTTTEALGATHLPSHTHTLSPSTTPTGTSGSGQAHDNMMPYLAVNYCIALYGTYPSRTGEGSSEGDNPFVSEVMMFAGNFAPRSWAYCDGQLLSVSQNDALFSLVGTIYGGDGRTTFGLPELRGRAVMHKGSGPGLTPRDQGAITGQETVILTYSQIPSHNHHLVDYGDAGSQGISPTVYYPVKLGADGARHLLVDASSPSATTGPRLGTSVDAELSSFVGNSNAADADNTRSPTNDEDGITLPFPLFSNPDSMESKDINISHVSGSSQTTSSFLNAWIDWNMDGDWDDTSEQLASDVNPGDSGVPYVLGITVPQNTPIGDTYMRFRISTQSGLSYTGLASDGEVEDYLVTVNEIATKVWVDNGTLRVDDVSASGVSSDLQFSIITIDTVDYVRVYDPSNVLYAGAGATAIDGNTIDVPISSITAAIEVDLLEGNDSVAVSGLDHADLNDGLSILGGNGTDSITFTSVASDTKDGNLTLEAEAVTLNEETKAGAGAVSITTDSISLGADLSGSSTLLIKPLTPSTSIGLGGGTGDLNLDDTELGYLVDGFSSITVGDTTSGTGTVTIDSATFLDPVTIAGGTINDGPTGTDLDAPSVTMIGTVSPGMSPGVLIVDGNYTFGDNATFTVEIGGTSPGTGNSNHDQLQASGSVDIGSNVTLSPASWLGFTPSESDSYVIISRTGGSGTFDEMAEGSIISTDFLGSGVGATITYIGGDGDDVEIIVEVLDDWGDAPTATQSGFTNSYPTLAVDNGAYHIKGGPILGAL